VNRHICFAGLPFEHGIKLFKSQKSYMTKYNVLLRVFLLSTKSKNHREIDTAGQKFDT